MVAKSVLRPLYTRRKSSWHAVSSEWLETRAYLEALIKKSLAHSGNQTTIINDRTHSVVRTH
jgi:hypothetical protein